MIRTTWMPHVLASLFAVSVSATAAARSSAVGSGADFDASASESVWSSPIYYDLQPSTEPVNALHVETMTPEQLLRLFMDLHTATEFEDAAATARLLIERLPTHPIGYYNLACALARLRNLETALDALEQSVHYGWRNVRHMRFDPDLDPLRHLQRFDELMLHVRRMNQVERMAASPLRRDPVEAIVTDIESFTPRLMARFQASGMSVALVRGGELVWSGAFGTDGSAVNAEASLRLSAPHALLALLAAQQLSNAGALPLESLLQEAAAMRRETELIEQPQVSTVRTVGWQTQSPIPNPERDPYRSSGETGQTDAQAIDESIVELLILAVEMAADQPFDSYCESQLLSEYGLESTNLRDSLPGAAPAYDGAIPNSRDLTTTCTDMAQLLAGVCSRTAHRNPVLDERAIERLGDMLGDLQDSRGLGARFQRTRAGGRIDVQEVGETGGCLLRFYPGNRSGIAIMFHSPGGIHAARSLAHLALGGTP